MATQTQINSLVALYVGYFDRAPDPQGLQFWIDQIDNGRAFNTIAEDFATSPEATALYPFLTTPDVSTPSTFIQSIYLNLFGRAAEAEGLNFWTGVLQSGSVSVADFIEAIINGAVDAPTATPPTFDKAVLDNKVTVGLDFATDAGNVANFTFDAAAKSAAVAAVNGVTEDPATVTDAQAATDAYLTGQVNVGQAFTLTTGADVVSGTAANDTIIASNPATAANATLTVGDSINGGAGTDTLNIIDANAFTGIPVGASVTNVENINVTAGGAITIDTTSNVTGATKLAATNSGAAQTLTAAATTDIAANTTAQAGANVAVNGGKDVTVAATGVTTGTTTIGATTAAAGDVNVNVTNSTGGTTTGNIAVTGGDTVTVTQAAGNAVNTTVTQAAVTVTGDAQTTAVTVNQDKAATAAATVVGKANGNVNVTDANAASATAAGTIETVTLNSFGAATVNSGALKTLALSGSGTSVNAGTLGALTTAANSALALNVNGLTTTGAVTIDNDIKTLNIDSSTAASTVNSLVANGATAVNVAGDAKLTLTGQTLGAVTDIVVTNSAGAAFGSQLGNAVNFTGGAGADAVSLGATTKAITMGAGDDTVTYGGAAGTGGSVAAGDGEDTIVMSGTEADGADADATFNSTFTGFEVLSVETGATQTVNLAGINGVSKVKTIGATGLTLNGMASGGTLTLTGPSTAVAVGVTNATFNAADVLNVALENSTATANAFGSITAADVETVNISTVDTGTDANTAATVDTATLVATGAKTVMVSGNNGLNLTNTGNVAITTFDASGVVGDGTDDTAANLAVTFASANTTATADVSITGGAGNDVLTGNAAKDTIIGGAGNDAISGGTGQDMLTGGEGRDAFAFNSDTNGAGADVTDSSTATADVVKDFSVTTEALTAANIANVAAFQGGAFGGAAADILSLDMDDTTGGADVAINVEGDVTNAAGQAAGVTVTVKDGILTVGGAGASNVDTIGEWLVEARAVAATAGDVLAFEFGGDTYIYGENGDADLFIELDGVTGATSLVEISGATTASTNSILFADIA